MSRQDIYNALGYGQNDYSIWRNTTGRQFRDANKALRTLRGWTDDVMMSPVLMSQDDYNDAVSSLKLDRMQGLTGSALSVLNGGMQTAGNTYAANQLGDMTSIDNGIDRLRSIGQQSYGSYDDIASAYGDLSYMPDVSYDTIRGGSKRERVGNITSSALAGATTGMTVGGPWGALIGGVVGGGASALGVLSGNASARATQRQKQTQANVAMVDASRNLNAASENYADAAHRRKIGTVLAEGGPIRSMTVKEFADKVLGNSKNSVIRSAGITRQHCKGGTMVRIKTR